LSRTATHKLPHYRAPHALKAATPTRSRIRSPTRSWISGFAIGVAASIAAVIVLRPHETTTAQMLVDSHVRAAQSNSHLLDVVSTNQHVVKPWFVGRLSYSPPVKDLAEQGFPLLGARIDVIEGQSVAVLVYQAGRHQLDLFVWPANSNVHAIARGQARGFNLVQWTEQEVVLTAVSDLNEHELRSFVERWRAAH
jgi:anti-sigma factor RsiW